jgi:hypothetical protein
MADIDYNAVAFYASHYMAMIAREHGSEGEGALRAIIETVREIYGKAIDPELCRGPIVVFKTLDPDTRPLPVQLAREITDLTSLAQDVKGSFVLQILDSGRYLLWKTATDVLVISEVAVVYVYEESRERFIANHNGAEVRKLIPAAASMFSQQTFSELKVALDEYRTRMIRHSSCPIFQTAWFDQCRLFFDSAPEHRLRDSLTHFLKIHLHASVEVRPEQNMDESHPVDIKVTWIGCNRIAVIEIKWLGKSRNKAGNITSNYGHARAMSGALQLSEYLDMNLQQAPLHVTRGYLVIIDARRYGMNESTVSLSPNHAFYYADEEIDFDPKFDQNRNDFETPIRMFAEPLCQ